MATRGKSLFDSDYPAITRLDAPNKSLEALGETRQLTAKGKCQREEYALPRRT
jgi:hypothetical protein